MNFIGTPHEICCVSRPGHVRSPTCAFTARPVRDQLSGLRATKHRLRVRRSGLLQKSTPERDGHPDLSEPGVVLAAAKQVPLA